jgi:pimeloyl-ACP methyl ester carboxylesterase
MARGEPFVPAGRPEGGRLARWTKGRERSDPSREREQRARDVTVRGVRVRAVEAGSPDAPPLLLIHGFLVNHSEFDDVIDALAQRFYVIAPDLPGFGDSEKPSPSRYAYGIETFAESIADLIAAFGVGRASVIGHSMGGAIGLTLAAHHAELVDRLVLVDALSYPFPLSFKARLPLMPIIGGIIFKQLYGRSMYRAYFRDDVFSKGAMLPLDRIDAAYDKFNGPSARESAYSVMHAILDTRPIVARIGRVRAPTLVVWGRDDKIFPLTNGQRLARDIHGASLEVMETGHSPHEEQPVEFVEKVAQFLEGKR